MSPTAFVGLDATSGADEAFAETHVDDGECSRCGGTGLTWDHARCDCGAEDEWAADDASYAVGRVDEREDGGTEVRP